MFRMLRRLRRTVPEHRPAPFTDCRECYGFGYDAGELPCPCV
jgi:hypothetical protein